MVVCLSVTPHTLPHHGPPGMLKYVPVHACLSVCHPSHPSSPRSSWDAETCTPPSMNRLFEAILNSKKFSCCVLKV